MCRHPIPTKHSGNTNLQFALERTAALLRQMRRDETTASRQIIGEKTMLRKVTLGLIAAASLGAAALAPTAASAGGFHWGHHHGWGHGYGYGVGFGPSLYINTGISNCYQQRMVETRRGLRLRTVNVCAYGY